MHHLTDAVRPRPLAPGDTIAIVSPASAVRPEYIDAARDVIAARGYTPLVMPHARGTHGSYSAPADDRFADLSAAFTDPAVRAILCSRGGYGTVHLLERLDRYYLEADPKWLIGFSDISALHALMHRHGIVSVHGSMCRALAEGHGDDEAAHRLFDILTGGSVSYSYTPHPLNRHGLSRGTLVGGNLAVLQALMTTRFDELREDTILLLEDIAEPIYKVERILWQLRLSGVLERLSGLVVGQFTDYKPDRNYDDMYSMIADMTAPYYYPVIYDAPHGHIPGNMPLLHGAVTLIDVRPDAATLTQY